MTSNEPQPPHGSPVDGRPGYVHAPGITGLINKLGIEGHAIVQVDEAAPSITARPMPEPTRYFYDTEFIEDGSTIELISIGIVADDGREYYAVNRDAPWKRIAKHDWLMDHVVPTLPRLHGDERLHRWILSRAGRRHNPCMLDFAHPHMRSHAQIADEVRGFLLAGEPELWAYYGAYDHVALCQLWGTMMDLPDGVPMWTHELMQEWERAGRPERPAQTGEHNALADARWNRELWRTVRDA